MEEFDFDFANLEPVEFRFAFLGKEYVLREPSEEATIKAHEFQFRNARMTAGGLTADAPNIAGAQSFLLSLCVVTAEDNRPVPVATVRSWPTSLVKALYKKAERMARRSSEETAEEIEKRIAEDQAKLDQVKAAGGYLKNLSAGTSDTSVSH